MTMSEHEFDLHYEYLMKAIQGLVEADPSVLSPQGELLGALAAACDVYERVRYPIAAQAAR